MGGSLLQGISERGAVLDAATSRPLHFGDPERELLAALETCVLADHSPFARVRATGRDILDLLHRLTTADLRALSPGEGRPAVVTTPKGRILERIFVHHLGADGILLVAGPGSAEKVRAHIERYTFREETGLEDASPSLAHLALLGPRAREVAASAGIPVPDPFGSTSWDAQGVRVHVLGQDGFSAEGVSLVFAALRTDEIGPPLMRALTGSGASPAGDLAVEAWRVLRGLPASGHELTEEHNPLEAGLWDAVSFTKGCYVGQEVVARLNTYDKVSRLLVGLLLPRGTPVPRPGTTVFAGERVAGAITSALVPPGRTSPVALAYVRREHSPKDTVLRVGSGEAAIAGLVAELPFGKTP